MQQLPTIDDRLLLILKADGGRSLEESVYEREKGANFVRKGYWQNLEKLTGIKASKWWSFAAGQQRPTPDMIEAAGRRWPQYAFWLVTGITDVANGHSAPSTVTIFPEFSHAEDHVSAEYFRESLKLLDAWLAKSKTPYFIERLHFNGKMLGTKGVDVAYALCETDEYKALQAKQTERESSLKGHKSKLTEPRQKPKAPPSDPRKEHQDNWDLFYKPNPSE